MELATTSGCDFLQDATINSQIITTDTIEKPYAYGAYNGSKNQ